MNNRRVVIFGSSGFLGSHIVKKFALLGYETVAFDKVPFPLYDQCLGLPIRQVIGDFFSSNDIRSVLKPGDVCIHLVSTTNPQTSNQNPQYDVQTNLAGTIQFLDAAMEVGVRKVVFASSGGAVYGPPKQTPIHESHATDPICSYGITKLAIEKFLFLYNKLHGLPYCCLRISNPYGPLQRTHASQGAIAVFMGKIMANEDIVVWGDGSIVRDFIYIEDVVSAFVAAIDAGVHDGIYNIGSGMGYSIKSIIGELREVVGKHFNVVYTPKRDFDVPSNVLDNTSAVINLQWSPRVALRDGLAATWEALQSVSVVLSRSSDRKKIVEKFTLKN